MNVQFYDETSQLKIVGQNDSWSDIIARISLPHHQPARKVVCAGQHVAALTHDGTIYLWSSVDFAEICTLPHRKPLIEMSLNSTGDMLISYGIQSSVLWEIPTGHRLLQIPNPKNSRAMSLVFADGDKKTLMASDDRVVRFTAINGPEANIQTEDTFTNTPKCMAISPSGALIGVCYRSFPLPVWDLNTSQFIGRCKRASARAGSDSGSSTTWFPVDFFTWNPVTGHIIGVYKDKTIFN